MYKGIYLALSGALTKYAQLEVISQNLANADTAGYKKESVSFNDHLLGLVNEQGGDGRTMTTITAPKTNFSPGAMVKTDNPFNVAVEGDGFIALEGNMFTRRGDIGRNAEGFLVTGNGERILGEKGPIKVPDGSLKINPDGGVSVGGAAVDTIMIRSFSDAGSLSKKGAGTFFSTEASRKSAAQLKQGYLEASNVEVVREMVMMIETLREFESFQKAIQMFDDATGKLNNELGRL